METETLLRRPPQATLPEKTQGFAPRAMTPVNSRVPDLLLYPTALLSFSDVDMVMT